MGQRNLRVIIAAEYPETRAFLKEIVKGEEGTFFVGQAPNGTRAVTLAKNLRPDVTIIDSNLPYFVGLDTVRLSRMGGLDAAQIISEAIPSSRVMIMTNLDRQVLTEHNLNMNAMAFFSKEKIGGNIPLKLEELCQEAVLPNAPVFANVEVELWTVHQQGNGQATEGALFIGGWHMATGLYLIGTLWLAPYGVLVLLVGAVRLAFGMLRKIIPRLRLKRSKTK